ncbi:hypothetical protein DIPPA_23837 [Diplonema papillatum]|nr:hypothetical protein DIPPA_23837 [Diplonema papillatum]
MAGDDDHAAPQRGELRLRAADEEQRDQETDLELQHAEQELCQIEAALCVALQRVHPAVEAAREAAVLREVEADRFESQRAAEERAQLHTAHRRVAAEVRYRAWLLAGERQRGVDRLAAVAVAVVAAVQQVDLRKRREAYEAQWHGFSHPGVPLPESPAARSRACDQLMEELSLRKQLKRLMQR